MATEVIKVIDPDMGSGYDYDSAYDWEAAQQGDLTGARNEIAVAKCRCTAGTADTTAVIIDGWTTSATQYIKIWTDPAESYRHSGSWSTGNKYILGPPASNPYAAQLVIIENYTQVKGLQVSAYNSTSRQGIYIDADYVLIEATIIKPSGASNNSAGIQLTSNVLTSAKIINCLIYDFNYSGDGNGIYEAANAAATIYFYNSTIYNCYAGVVSYGDQLLAKNVIIQDCGAGGCWSGSFHASCTNNNSDDNTQPGSNGRNGEVTFVNEGADDFHLDPSDTVALGYGLNLYNDATYPFQTDIDGQDRGGAAASWDIGADEYVSAASIEQEGFRFRNDDGSESAATWKANQDTNITLAADTAARIRMLLNATGDPASIGAQLEYRYKPSGGAFGSWTKVN
jgi:hypothetical protein